MWFFYHMIEISGVYGIFLEFISVEEHLEKLIWVLLELELTREQQSPSKMWNMHAYFQNGACVYDSFIKYHKRSVDRKYILLRAQIKCGKRRKLVQGQGSSPLMFLARPRRQL